MPSPVPALVVGANGPKMAALAGEHADAVNLHSWASDLASLIAVARRAARRDSFDVTVEAPSEPVWLDPDGDQRRRLVELGVDELILAWNRSVDPNVLRAG